MSAPRVGFHARIRKRAISRYAEFYGPLDKDEAFVVEAMDNVRGRGTVYLRRAADSERLIPVWRSDVKAFPRCDHCNREGHTVSRCPALKTADAEAGL